MASIHSYSQLTMYEVGGRRSERQDSTTGPTRTAAYDVCGTGIQDRASVEKEGVVVRASSSRVAGGFKGGEALRAQGPVRRDKSGRTDVDDVRPGGAALGFNRVRVNASRGVDFDNLAVPNPRFEGHMLDVMRPVQKQEHKVS